MSEDRRGYRPKVGGGLAFFFLVLTVGLVLTAFGISIGGGASARVPFTEVNISAGGSLGKKEAVQQVLPNYLQNRVASNNDLFNQTTTLTIWIAEGIAMIVLGNQPEAPIIDLNLNLTR